MEETSDTDSQEQAVGATIPGPSSSLTVQVSEEIAKNVGELAAETAIAFAMSRATSKEHPPKRDPGSGSSMRQTVPVKKPRGRPRKEPKNQLPVIAIARANRDKPTPEGKKLSSLAGSGEGKNDPPKTPPLLSGQQISRIMGQAPMQQIHIVQNSSHKDARTNTDPGPSMQALQTITDPPAILTSPVKRKRGRPKKVRELVQPAPIVNPEPISESASEISIAEQPPFTELDGWPIAAITVNDGAGNIQPAALVIMHPSNGSSQSVAKRPRGRPKKHPPVAQPIVAGIDTEAMDVDSGKASTAARLEDVDALSQCEPEAEMSVSEVTPPGDTAPVKRKRGRPPKNTPTTAPAIKRPRGRPKKTSTATPAIKRPRGRPKKTSTATPAIKRPRGRPKKTPTTTPVIKRPRGRPKKTPPATPVVKRPRGRPKKPRPLVAPQQHLPPLGPQLLLSLQPRPPPVDPQMAHEGLRSTETSVDVSLSPTAIKTVKPKKRVVDSRLLQQPHVSEANRATTVETASVLVAAVSEESTVAPAKRKRGRPPKPKPLETQIKPKRPIGRPRKSSLLPPPPTSSSHVTSTPIKRPRGRPPKHLSPAKPHKHVTAEVTSEATTMVYSTPAVPEKQPRSRSRKNPQPKQIRLNEATVFTCTHSAIVEISPPATEPQVLAPRLVRDEDDPDVMKTQVPDVPLPRSPLPPVSDSKETAKVNSTDAPNIPQPFEILSRVRNVLPPENASNGLLCDTLVLQRAEPPTTACMAANGVHTVLSPVINVGRPRKRPLPQDLAKSSLQTFEGLSQTEEPLTVPVKRPRGRPPKKRQSLEQTPATDPPIKRRPGRPRKHPLPSPSLTEAGTTSETKHEGILIASLSTKQTSATAVNVPIKRSVGRPKKTPSLSAATAERTPTPQPSQPPDIPAKSGPGIILPKVGEILGQVPTPLIHGEIKVKRGPRRPRKRPLEAEPDKECSSAPDGGLPVKKRRGRPLKKRHVQLNETDETSSVCPPDGGTLTAQVKAVMTALPNESATKDSSSKAGSAMNISLTSDTSDKLQSSSSNFQLRLSVSFSDSSDDGMDSEGDTRTALQILADRVKSDRDPKAEESEDESSSSYTSTFD